VTDFGQCRLLDESKQELDTNFKRAGALQSGDTLDFERYLVEVDEVDEAGDSADGPAREPARSAHSFPPPGCSSALAQNSTRELPPGRAQAQGRRGGLRAGAGLAPLHPRSEQGPSAPHHPQAGRGSGFALHPSRPPSRAPTAVGAHAQRAQHFQERLDAEHNASYDQCHPRTAPSLCSFEQELHGQGAYARMHTPSSEHGLSPQRSCDVASDRHELAAPSVVSKNPALGGPRRAPARNNAAILALLGLPAEAQQVGPVRQPSAEGAALTQGSGLRGVACSYSSAAGPGAGARQDCSSSMALGWATPRSHAFSSLQEGAADPLVRRKNQLLDDDDDAMETEVQGGRSEPSDSMQGRLHGERIFSSSFSVHGSMDINDENKDPAPVEDAGESRKGFLVLRDHAPQGCHLGLSSSKRQRTGPPPFAAPRPFSDSGHRDGRVEDMGGIHYRYPCDICILGFRV
jgi:hypothetical protein